MYSTDQATQTINPINDDDDYYDYDDDGGGEK